MADLADLPIAELKIFNDTETDNIVEESEIQLSSDEQWFADFLTDNYILNRKNTTDFALEQTDFFKNLVMQKDSSLVLLSVLKNWRELSNEEIEQEKQQAKEDEERKTEEKEQKEKQDETAIEALEKEEEDEEALTISEDFLAKFRSKKKTSKAVPPKKAPSVVTVASKTSTITKPVAINRENQTKASQKFKPVLTKAGNQHKSQAEKQDKTEKTSKKKGSMKRKSKKRGKSKEKKSFPKKNEEVKTAVGETTEEELKQELLNDMPEILKRKVESRGKTNDDDSETEIETIAEEEKKHDRRFSSVSVAVLTVDQLPQSKFVSQFESICYFLRKPTDEALEIDAVDSLEKISDCFHIGIIREQIWNVLHCVFCCQKVLSTEENESLKIVFEAIHNSSEEISENEMDRFVIESLLEIFNNCSHWLKCEFSENLTPLLENTELQIFSEEIAELTSVVKPWQEYAMKQIAKMEKTTQRIENYQNLEKFSAELLANFACAYSSELFCTELTKTVKERQIKTKFDSFDTKFKWKNKLKTVQWTLTFFPITLLAEQANVKKNLSTQLCNVSHKLNICRIACDFYRNFGISNILQLILLEISQGLSAHFSCEYFQQIIDNQKFCTAKEELEFVCKLLCDWKRSLREIQDWEEAVYFQILWHCIEVSYGMQCVFERLTIAWAILDDEKYDMLFDRSIINQAESKISDLREKLIKVNFKLFDLTSKEVFVVFLLELEEVCSEVEKDATDIQNEDPD